jgi:hypothetical protein
MNDFEQYFFKGRLEVDFNRIGVGIKSKWSEGKAW